MNRKGSESRSLGIDFLKHSIEPCPFDFILLQMDEGKKRAKKNDHDLFVSLIEHSGIQEPQGQAQHRIRHKNNKSCQKGSDETKTTLHMSRPYGSLLLPAPPFPPLYPSNISNVICTFVRTRRSSFPGNFNFLG